MTYEEFSKLLKERYEKGESTNYSYSSPEPRFEKSDIEVEEPILGRRYFPLDFINGEMSLYIKPPTDMGNLPYVTGLVGYTNVYYYG